MPERILSEGLVAWGWGPNFLASLPPWVLKFQLWRKLLRFPLQRSNTFRSACDLCNTAPHSNLPRTEAMLPHVREDSNPSRSLVSPETNDMRGSPEVQKINDLLRRFLMRQHLIENSI